MDHTPGDPEPRPDGPFSQPPHTPYASAEGQQYAQYYRQPSSGQVQYGSPEKLKALAEGYFGLNWVFLANIVGVVLVNVLVMQANEPLVLVGALMGLFLLVLVMTLSLTRRIAFGKGWQPGIGVLASFLMGFNSIVCCGIFGYVVMQQIAGQEIKRYGVKAGLLGFKKRDVEGTLAQMKSAQPPMGFDLPGRAGP
jgi:hypothetical protein